MNMIEFLDSRLVEEEAQLVVTPDHKWQRVCELIRLQVALMLAALEQREENPHRHPAMAGLLPAAMVWDQHPDYDPQAWLPDNGLGTRGRR